MSVNFDQVRILAPTYTNAVRTMAATLGRDLNTEAVAMIIGAARAIAYPEDQIDGLLKAAIEDARDPVEP